MFILGGLVAAIILVRQVRWLAMIAVLITIGYIVRGYLNDDIHLDGREKMMILRH
jgi:hypothetical protein